MTIRSKMTTRFRKGALLIFISLSITFYAKAQEGNSNSPTNSETLPSIKIGGYAQVRAEWSNQDNSTPTYTIPATRIELKTKISDAVSYSLSMEGTGGTLKLYDSFIKLSYTPQKLFDMKIGQFKYGFGLEQTTADTDLELVNKSYITSFLVFPSRDIGVEISRAFSKIPLKPFISIGGYNGEGSNTPAQNDYGMRAIRATISPIEGLNLGSSYYDGKTGATKTDKKRHGYEIYYENKVNPNALPILLKGEYIAALDGSTDKNGYYLTLGYHLFPVAKWQTPEIMIVTRYDFYDTNSKISDDEISRLTLGTIFQYDKYFSFRMNYEFKAETPSVANDILTFQFQVKF